MKKNKIKHLNHQFFSFFEGRTLTGMPAKGLSLTGFCLQKGQTLVETLKNTPNNLFFPSSKTSFGLSDQPKTLVGLLWHSLNQIANLPQAA